MCSNAEMHSGLFILFERHITAVADQLPSYGGREALPSCHPVLLCPVHQGVSLCELCYNLHQCKYVRTLYIYIMQPMHVCNLVIS